VANTSADAASSRTRGLSLPPIARMHIFFFQTLAVKASNILWRYEVPYWLFSDATLNDLEMSFNATICFLHNWFH